VALGADNPAKGSAC